MSDPGHWLHIETRFDDGSTREWAYDQPGPAADAHADLVRRWKAAGHVFTADRAALSITRLIVEVERGGPYTDVITHIPWTEESP